MVQDGDVCVEEIFNMIMIEYKGLQASWSSKSGRWASTNKKFMEVLNGCLPDEDDISADTPFRIGGIDKIVLDKVKEVFGKVLKVIAFYPNAAPEEVKGIDY